MAIWYRQPDAQISRKFMLDSHIQIHTNVNAIIYWHAKKKSMLKFCSGWENCGEIFLQKTQGLNRLYSKTPSPSEPENNFIYDLEWHIVCKTSRANKRVWSDTLNKCTYHLLFHY